MVTQPTCEIQLYIKECKWEGLMNFTIKWIFTTVYIYENKQKYVHPVKLNPVKLKFYYIDVGFE